MHYVSQHGKKHQTSTSFCERHWWATTRKGTPESTWRGKIHQSTKDWSFEIAMIFWMQSLQCLIFFKIKKASSYPAPPETPWNCFFFFPSQIGAAFIPRNASRNYLAANFKAKFGPNIIALPVAFSQKFRLGPICGARCRATRWIWVSYLTKSEMNGGDCLNLHANHAPVESASHSLRQITNWIHSCASVVDPGACVTWCHYIEKMSLLHFIYISSRMTVKILPKLQPSTCCIQRSWHDRACQTWLAHSQIE